MKSRDQQLDQLLDKTLAEYGNAEPRFGLENRVVASLEAEGARIAGQRRWWWILGTVSATAAVAAVVWMGDGPADSHAKFQPAGAAVRSQSAATAIATEGDPSGPGTGVSSANRPTRIKASLRAIRPHPGEQLAKATPKLEQFPSPVPLSEQEKILARYITQYPEHALLIARAQTALEQQDQREKSQGTLEGSGAPRSTH
jgi:hypothetical protein